MIRRRITVGMVLVLCVAGSLFAQVSLGVSATPSVRLSIANPDDTLGPGYGGTLEMNLLFGSVPIRLATGSGAYGFVPSRSDMTGAAMLTPYVSAVYAPRVQVADLVMRPFIGAAYRHYLSWHSFSGSQYFTYRPIASLTGGAEFPLSTRIEVGPAVSYDLVFDNELRHVLELGLRVSFAL